MSPFSQIQHLNLRDHVVEQIRSAIIGGHLRPGDHIVESALTIQLGVSRTPVREALILLEREGLVVSVPNRGSFVRVFTESDVEAIFGMRLALENYAAELVLPKFDDHDRTRLEQLIHEQSRYTQQADFQGVRSTDMAFHQHLIERAKNPLLLRTWSELVAQVAALLHLRAEGVPDHDEYQAIVDHRAILDGLVRGDFVALKDQHERINRRVAGECRIAVQRLSAASA